MNARELAKDCAGLLILIALVVALALALDGGVAALMGAWHGGMGLEP